MTRASIACVECRRSKTKCHNNGAGTVCKTCAAKNKQCTYLDGVPSSATSGSSRRESTLGEVDVSDCPSVVHDFWLVSKQDPTLVHRPECDSLIELFFDLALSPRC
jgi:hypothetical protein